jgi:hypothetical protein
MEDYIKDYEENYFKWFYRSLRNDSSRE